MRHKFVLIVAAVVAAVAYAMFCEVGKRVAAPNNSSSSEAQVDVAGEPRASAPHSAVTRELASEPVVRRAGEGSLGQLLFLNSITGSPVPGLELRLDQAVESGNVYRHSVTDAFGSVSVEPGEWSISLEDGADYFLMSTEASIVAYESVTIFAAPLLDLVVEVKDVRGAPLPHAEVSLAVAAPVLQFPIAPGPALASVACDALGNAMFSRVPLSCVSVAVTCPGFGNAGSQISPYAKHVRVVLEPLSDLVDVLIVDALTGEPVKAPFCFSPHGVAMPLPQGQGGGVSLSRSQFNGRVWVGAPQYASVLLRDVVPRVELRPVAVLQVRNKSNSPSTVCVVCLDDAGRQISWEQGFKVAANESVEVELPEGQKIALHAANDIGQSAQGEVQIEPGRNIFDLRLRAGPTIDVGVDDAAWVSDQGAFVRAVYRGQGVVLVRPDDAGRASVGVTPGLLFIDVCRSGQAIARLLPKPGVATGDLAGTVSVPSRDIVTFTIQASYENGDPASGVAVSLRGRDMLGAQRVHASLHGSWPTNHSCWLLRQQPEVSGISATGGSIDFHLTRGTYDVTACVPAERAGQVREVALRGRPLTVLVERDATEQVQIQRRRPLSLSVRSVGGSPVSHYRVSGSWASGAVAPEYRGQNVLVWVPHGEHELMIAAEGGLSGVVSFDDSTEHVDALVTAGARSSNATVVVENAVGVLSGKRIDLIAQDPTTGREVWRSEVQLDESCAARLLVPLRGPLLFDMRGVDRPVKVDGLQVEWIPGTEVRFRLRR